MVKLDAACIKHLLQGDAEVLTAVVEVSAIYCISRSPSHIYCSRRVVRNPAGWFLKHKYCGITLYIPVLLAETVYEAAVAVISSPGAAVRHSHAPNHVNITSAVRNIAP